MAYDAEEGKSSGGPWPWLREGLRSAAFLRVRLSEVQASPLAIAALAGVLVIVGLLLQRVAVAGPAIFYWQAITAGWLTPLLLLWVCWLVARQRTSEERSAPLPSAATMFGVLLVQQLVISLPLWLIYLALEHAGPQIAPRATAWLLRAIPYVVIGWIALAGACFLWRQTLSAGLLRLTAVAVFVVTGVLDVWAPAAQFWYPDESKARASETEAEDPRPHLTQAALEAQSSAVIRALNSLQAERPGVTDLYAITFAPYADEDVFRREVTMVSDVMRKRFDAEGRVIQLQNHAATLSDVPWATPLNLQRAIQRVAALMDRNEDILFIHLTSHGAKDGKLSASFWPLEVDPVTPQLLRTWLDEAGIRFRVISVSACFAGAWVAPLSDPGTLMMTASDADHTSYGCGRKSELTFFGRAMYDEQLRTVTHSFEAAHAAAREVIARREQEAGKTDGYSNPQISVGELIRPRLAALQAQLEAAK